MTEMLTLALGRLTPVWRQDPTQSIRENLQTSSQTYRYPGTVVVTLQTDQLVLDPAENPGQTEPVHRVRRIEDQLSYHLIGAGIVALCHHGTLIVPAPVIGEHLPILTEAFGIAEPTHGRYTGTGTIACPIRGWQYATDLSVLRAVLAAADPAQLSQALFGYTRKDLTRLIAGSHVNHLVLLKALHDADTAPDHLVAALQGLAQIPDTEKIDPVPTATLLARLSDPALRVRLLRRIGREPEAVLTVLARCAGLRPSTDPIRVRTWSDLAGTVDHLLRTQRAARLQQRLDHMRERIELSERLGIDTQQLTIEHKLNPVHHVRSRLIQRAAVKISQHSRISPELSMYPVLNEETLIEISKDENLKICAGNDNQKYRRNLIEGTNLFVRFVKDNEHYALAQIADLEQAKPTIVELRGFDNQILDEDKDIRTLLRIVLS